MSAPGFTPISLYYSTTAAAAPSAGNLAAGELAVNITDGKLFYKDNGGVVRVLATAAGAAGDVVGPGSSTDNALVRFDGTTGKLVQSSVGVLDDSGNLSGIAALTTSGALTLNAGTANGVAYLNGSKVLTTGSALTFDGTTLNVGIGGVGKIQVGTASSATYQTGFYGSNGVDTDFQIRFKTGITEFGTGTSTPLAFSYGGSEQMRLTSTGLGIGTSSPGAKLQIGTGSATGLVDNVFLGGYSTNTAQFRWVWNRPGAGCLGIGTANDAYGSMIFGQASGVTGAVGTEWMRLDSSGNLGLGVVPNVWFSNRKAIQINNAGSSIAGFSGGGVTELRNNSYVNAAGTEIYSNTAGAAVYVMAGGQSAWYNAPSGTAGNAISFTQAMTLDSSGNLLVGTTSVLGAGRISSVSSQNGISAQTTASANSFEAIVASRNGNVGKVITLWHNVVAGVQAGFINIDSTSTVSLNNTSDYRTKKDILPLEKSLDRVARLRPVSFKYKADGYSAEGFIAHEFAEVLPNAVHGEKDAVDANGNPIYQALDYTKVIPILVSAIQEQQAIITALTARVAALESN